MKKITFSIIALIVSIAFVNAQTINSAALKKFSQKKIAPKQSVQQVIPYKYGPTFIESFETSVPPTGWTVQSPDGGTGWAQVANATTPYPGYAGGTTSVPPGGGGFTAYCTYTTGGTASNDQWLITPQFNVAAGDSVAFQLLFFGAYIDTMYIKLSTTGNNTTDFTTILATIDTVALTPMDSWNTIAFSLTPYVGQNIYIAFQEKIADNLTDGAFFNLDLVKLGQGPVGINSIYENKNLSVYPNPANDLVNVSSANDIQLIKMTNVLGEVVYENANQGKTLNINTADFATGVYVIQFVADGKTITKKVQIIK